MIVQKYWLDAAKSIKKAVLGQKQVCLQNHSFRLTYESRKARDDRDYPFLVKLAQGKKCIFDVGANHGITALLMASAMSNTGQLYAFEASEKACQIIQENAQLNQLTEQIQIVNAVLAERSGITLDFYWSEASGGASILYNYLGHIRPLQKITLALGDFVAQTGVSPELIKIDVEGAERRVLAGCQQMMRKASPTIFLELHSWQEMSLVDNAQLILNDLAGVDYKMIYLRTKEIVQDASCFAERGRCHVILMPNERPLPEWLPQANTENI